MIKVESLESRRLMAAGALDTSFGGDGSADVKTTTKTYGLNGSDVTVDDQKRVLIGALYRKNRQITVTRVNVNGSIDATFGSNGIATIKLPSTKSASSFQVAADHNGRVLVLYGNYLVRLNSSGVIDKKKFGGKNAEVNVPIVRETADLTVDADNNPLIIGTSAGKTGDRATIVKLRRTGVLEKTFGSGGAYKTPVPVDSVKGVAGDATGQTLKVLADGDIVGVARVHTSYLYVGVERGDDGISAFRLSRHGLLDTSYGTNGSTTVSMHRNDFFNKASSFEGFFADGSMLIANTEKELGGYDHSRIWTRLDANGDTVAEDVDLLPDALGTAGGTEYVTNLAAVQADGKLIMRRYNQFFRLNADYSLDASFTLAGSLPATVTTGRVLNRGDSLILVSPTMVGTEAKPSSFNLTAIQL